jgi:hypothetical protein
MGLLAVTGATCMCPFGSAPCTLQVTSQMTCLAEGKPVGTIQDMQPGTNLATFGMCMSLANPTVAAATAAALGVLTPQPCTMVPAGTWIPSNPTVLAEKKPVLTNEATLVCGFGAGTIKITSPGQTKVLV